MKAAVLGPLDMQEDYVSAVPTGLQPKKVLALLLLNDSRVIPVSSFIDELWGPTPPRSAPSMVQNYILLIRKGISKALGIPLKAVSRTILQTRGRGYVLVLPEGYFDLHAYRSLESQGHVAFQQGDYSTAAERFSEAIDLWNGEALVDLDHGSLLKAEVRRLEESRDGLIAGRIDSDLRLGRNQKVLSELAGLVTKNRFDEGLHGRFILALYRSGHRARALETYSSFHGRMIEELGIEPNQAMRRLQQAMLLSDEALLDPRLQLSDIGILDQHSNQRKASA